MQYLFVACGGITVFILTLLLGKGKKAISDYILAFILLTILQNLWGLFLLNTLLPPFSVGEELVLEFSEASIFLHGPLLWLYTRSLTENGFSLSRKYMVHFTTFVVALGYFFLGVLTFLEVTKAARNTLLVLKLISLGSYVMLSLRLLGSHQKKIHHLFSNLEHKKLTWLRFLCQSILGIGFIAVMSLLVDRFTSLTVPQYGGILTNIALCAFVYALGYFGFRQEFIFQSSSTSDEKVKYAKSGLDEVNSRKAYSILKDFFEQEKPYLDPDLTLFSLADKLDLKSNHLSQIINSYSASNFYDFVNRYRVEEAMQRISSPEVLKMTLLGIGLSCGFSSKTTFNRAFKKYTGHTPSEYKKLQAH
ncbi:MAG: helix-turn-helix domain-containing protein [Bacteroidota bacterium]